MMRTAAGTVFRSAQLLICRAAAVANIEPGSRRDRRFDVQKRRSRVWHVETFACRDVWLAAWKKVHNMAVALSILFVAGSSH